MAKKKSYRADNTYLISIDTKDNPKLGAKLLSNGQESLYLEYYYGYDRESKKVYRKRVKLGMYLYADERTIEERTHNKLTLQRAKQVRYEREQQLLEDREGYRVKQTQKADFLDFFQSYIDSHSKDVRLIALSFARFKDFLNDTPEYRKFAVELKPEYVTKEMMAAFAEYLQERGTQDGASTYFARFKKVVKYAVEHDVLRKNPCTGIVIKADTRTLAKDVLSDDEIRQLINTHYDKESDVLRRAFIFSLFTGIRWCDVKDLTFANVDFGNRQLKFEQNKTKGHSCASMVTIPLDDFHLSLIKTPQNPQISNERIFPLPSFQSCNKSLDRWVKRANIDKHITWHCARHTFGTRCYKSTKDIVVTASLLGHSSLNHTQKYVRADDTKKQEAINQLTKITL